MSEKILHIDAGDFDRAVLQGDRVVVDFYSTECPPCEALASKFEALAELYGDDVRFVKIFRQGNRELAESLGVTSSPTVLFYKQGRRVGEVLTGGIKRARLAANLNALLPPERVERIEREVNPVTTTCDVLILGGGPAGLTAGIYAAQAKLRTLLVDNKLPGGWVTTTHQVSNYPGFAEPVAGFMLAHLMAEQARAAGVEFRAAVDVTGVDLHRRTVTVDGLETVKARKIIISTGSSPRPLGVPGELEYQGKGISYCATCDAKYYQDREVVVVGGGNSAIEESLFISRFAETITVVHQFDRLQAHRSLQEKALADSRIRFLFEREPREFARRDGRMLVTMEELRTGRMERLETDGVFIFAGTKPNLELFGGLLELDRHGYVKTDRNMRTNIDHVYAVGDIRSKEFRQITTAVSDGTIAAMSATRELEPATELDPAAVQRAGQDEAQSR
ncbi:MAG: FAD-dependent oxidoreductase [Spirochaetota bacterium]